jgi:hypothetical protein
MIVRQRLAHLRASTVVVICLVALVCAGAASAGPPGRWDPIAQGANVPGSMASELGLARTADGRLHVAWKELTKRDGAGTQYAQIAHTWVTAAGRPVGGTTFSKDDWVGLSDPELVVDRSGGLRVYFGGLRTTQPGEPLAGLLTATAPASGASWSAPSVIHQDGARKLSATDARDGTHNQAWYGAGGIYLHRGLDAALGDNLFTAGPTVNQFGPTVVDDAAGRLWVSWCGFGGNAGGLFVQRADPASGAPIGAARKLPGSTTPYQGAQVSTCNLERTDIRRTPMVARAGGGVFIAGSTGYPGLRRVNVWRIDPSGQVPAGSFVVGEGAFPHYTPALAAAPDGRIWVAWLEPTSVGGTIAARRSNRLGTVWGKPVRVRAPGNWILGALNIAAQRDRLDVLGLMHTPNPPKSIQHTQLLPGLTLRHVGTARRPNGSVVLTFRVTDAGDPVAGARVTVRGVSVLTGGDGNATVVLAAPRPGALRATGSKAGYVGDTTGFRCCQG